MRKDDELENTAYLHEAVYGTYSEMHNNANWRSIAISLKRIAGALEASKVKLDIIANSVSRGFFELKESIEDK